MILYYRQHIILLFYMYFIYGIYHIYDIIYLIVEIMLFQPLSLLGVTTQRSFCQ